MKLSSTFLFLFLLIHIVSIPLYAQEEKDGFIYIIENNVIKITGWKGSTVDVIIPAVIDGIPVRRIGRWAFQNSKINSAVISEGITIIEYMAFDSCSITAVTLPGSIQEIDYAAFSKTPISTIKVSGRLKSEAINIDAFPSCFQTWFNLYESLEGIYTLKNKTWRMENKNLPPYGIIICEPGVYANPDKGGPIEVGKYLLPPGRRTISLRFDDNIKRSAGTTSYNFTIEADKTYRASAVLGDHSISYKITPES